MTREEYINLRNTDRQDVIVYNHYNTYFNPEKHKKLLSFNEFFEYFMQWDYNQAIYLTISYYDALFTVLKINTGKRMLYV